MHLQGFTRTNPSLERSSVKKSKQENLKYFEEIANKIYSVRETIRSNSSFDDHSKIEVEARLGMIVDGYRRWKHKSNVKSVALGNDLDRSMRNLQFKAGIDPIFARKLKKKLSTKEITATTQPLQIQRSDNNNNRWQVNDRGGISDSENKTPFYRIDIALLAHDYDLRINGATESALVNNNKNGINYNAWQQQRIKRRVCYTHCEYKSWRMDYTEVDVSSNPQDGSTLNRSRELEFEFEMEESVKLQWLRETGTGLELTEKIARHLVALVDLLVPFDTEDTTEQSLQQVDYMSELVSVNDSLRYSDTRRFEFLGSMPVNLSRQNLVNVTNTKYFLTEKSDGIRYLMYIIHDSATNRPIAVLVDRAKKAYRFRGSEEIGSFLLPGSVLDGELVFNRTFKENVFLIFDVLAWNGVSYVKHNFSTRSDVIQTHVMSTYSANYMKWIKTVGEQQQHSQPSRPIMLIRKNFVDKSALMPELLSYLRTEDGERVFRRDDKRHHKSDGIIFQPDSEYVFSKHYDLLKWKWAELRSVDLQVVDNLHSRTRASDLLCLMCCGDDGSQINCTMRGTDNIGLGVFDTYRLRADKEDPSLDHRMAPIVEVAYDINIGMWEYMHLRRDKGEPNFITTVMGVFMEQAESISVEELEYILNAASCGMENDYEAQVAKMKTKLLDWQRREFVKQK